MHFSSQTEQLLGAKTDIGTLMRVGAQLEFPMHYDEQSICEWEFSVEAVGVQRNHLWGTDSSGK